MIGWLSLAAVGQVEAQTADAAPAETPTDPIPAKPELPTDPNYTPPERSKIGSIHDAPNADSPPPAAAPVEFQLDGPLLYVAIAGGLLLIGVVAGLISRIRGRA